MAQTSPPRQTGLGPETFVGALALLAFVGAGAVAAEIGYEMTVVSFAALEFPPGAAFGRALPSRLADAVRAKDTLFALALALEVATVLASVLALRAVQILGPRAGRPNRWSWVHIVATIAVVVGALTVGAWPVAFFGMWLVCLSRVAIRATLGR